MGLAERLSKEEFDGQPIEWIRGHWSKIRIEFSENGGNHFYKQRKRIFVHPKNQNRAPYCYECGTEAQVITQVFPKYDGIFNFSGEGRTTNEDGFYCENCDGELPSNVIRTQQILCA